jgi:hypothetical protein
MCQNAASELSFKLFYTFYVPLWPSKLLIDISLHSVEGAGNGEGDILCFEMDWECLDEVGGRVSGLGPRVR